MHKRNICPLFWAQMRLIWSKTKAPWVNLSSLMGTSNRLMHRSTQQRYLKEKGEACTHTHTLHFPMDLRSDSPAKSLKDLCHREPAVSSHPAHTTSSHHQVRPLAGQPPVTTAVSVSVLTGVHNIWWECTCRKRSPNTILGRTLPGRSQPAAAGASTAESQRWPFAKHHVVIIVRLPPPLTNLNDISAAHWPGGAWTQYKQDGFRLTSHL